MTSMEPFEVYRSYLALKLHFTTDKYDVIKQQGRVRASKQSFFKRTDLFSIKKIATDYSDKEVVDFLVANFEVVIDGEVYLILKPKLRT